MKPKILISKCLGFDNCRYDGSIVQFDLLDKMKDQIEFIPLCPEIEIGLGLPRESLRLIKVQDGIELVQPKSKKYLTCDMKKYSQEILKDISDIDGIILKGRSPSCGIKDVKVYSGMEKSPVIGKSMGLFAAEMEKHFPYLPIEEEGRLTNLIIREHFFTKLYAIFNFKKMAQNKSIKKLADYHAKNKYLYFAYNQPLKNKLGSIVANHEKLETNIVLDNYFNEMVKLFSNLPSKKNYINAYQHIFGYFSKFASKEEKVFILQLMEKYRDGKIDKSAIASILKVYSIKYNIEYLLGQTIFEPFPEELLSLNDSGKL
ncbi:TPA: YbgA family protein [Streptococcus suis]